MVKIRKYRKRLFAIIAIIISSAFIVNAESNYFVPNYSDISNAVEISKEVSSDIESYDISYYFMHKETGDASWYGKRFHNRKTASGERYNMYALTAAHKKLPLGAIVRVTNNKTGETALLKINDRGPYVKKRIIDLSYSAAQRLSGPTNPKVKIETLLAQDNASLIPDDDEYYFGFSYDLPLVCIPSNVVEIITTTEDFDKAVSEYEKIRNSNKEKFVYLFTEAGKIKYKYNNLNEKYYIGIFSPSQNKQEIIVKK